MLSENEFLSSIIVYAVNGWIFFQQAPHIVDVRYLLDIFSTVKNQEEEN
jgi:hypothetical protein